jgi:hypothetical protein
MGNLSHYAGSSSGLNQVGSNTPGSPGETPEHGAAADGYASEDFVPGSSSACRERKKGLEFFLFTFDFINCCWIYYLFLHGYDWLCEELE